MYISQTFNSSLVWDAYISPSVDTSDEQFEWGTPDLDAIKEYPFHKQNFLFVMVFRFLGFPSNS